MVLAFLFVQKFVIGLFSPELFLCLGEPIFYSWIMIGVPTKIRDLGKRTICMIFNYRGWLSWNSNNSGHWNSLKMQFHFSDAQWFPRKCPNHWIGMKGTGPVKGSPYALVVSSAFLSLIWYRLTQHLTPGQACFWKMGMLLCVTGCGLCLWVFISQSSGEEKHKAEIATYPHVEYKMRIVFTLAVENKLFASEQKGNWRPEMNLNKRLKWSRV